MTAYQPNTPDNWFEQLWNEFVKPRLDRFVKWFKTYILD